VIHYGCILFNIYIDLINAIDFGFNFRNGVFVIVEKLKKFPSNLIRSFFFVEESLVHSLYSLLVKISALKLKEHHKIYYTLKLKEHCLRWE